jgi:hypothetical protein
MVYIIQLITASEEEEEEEEEPVDAFPVPLRMHRHSSRHRIENIFAMCLCCECDL